MRTSSLSMAQLLRIASCIVFDIAVLIAYFNIFSIFTVIEPVRSILMLLVLLMGLTAINAAVLYYNQLTIRFGIVHTTAIILVSFAYGFIANLVSVLAIPASTTYYVVWELIIIAAFLSVLSIINVFAQKVMSDNRRDEIEQTASQSVLVQLMDVEATLLTRKYSNNILPVQRSFKELKERIQASTPFGRVIGNRNMIDIEKAVQSNLEYISLQTKLDLSDTDISDLQRMLDETRRLVINREALNIK